MSETSKATATPAKASRKVRSPVGAEYRISLPDPGAWYLRHIKMDPVRAKIEWMKDAAKDFNAFLSDHKSQNGIRASVEVEYADCCSACGEKWETQVDDDGVTLCANCGEPVEETR